MYFCFSVRMYVQTDVITSHVTIIEKAVLFSASFSRHFDPHSKKEHLLSFTARKLFKSLCICFSWVTVWLKPKIITPAVKGDKNSHRWNSPWRRFAQPKLGLDRAIKAFKNRVLYHGEDCNRGPKTDPTILEPALLLVNRCLHDVLAGLFAASLVDRLSVVNRRVVGAVVPCQNVLPQREILEITGREK